MTTLWHAATSKLLRGLSRFARERSGNVAITFAFATLPVIGAAGAAVDYSHANNVKAALQAALDSTALMLARDAADLNSSDLNTRALNYFKAMFDRPEAKNVTVSATYTTTGGSKVLVNGSAAVPTTFVGIMGYNNITVSGSSTTAWGTTRLRVALVLDNTGSMADAGKMTALKSATKDLLTQLKNAATVNGDVYVSIIPFAKDVNIGASNYAANYIDWTDWNSDNQSCSNGGGWGGWGGGGWGWGGWSWGGGGGSGCSASNHNTWNGCVTDRGPSNAPGNSTWDQVITAPDGTANSKWPAEQYDACPVAMKGLSYDWASMNSLVDQMQPNGSTNQPIGLVWGWQSLVGGGPLTAPVKDSNYNYSDIIILMSDGLNTQDRWYGNGSSISTAVDNRMYQTGNGSGTCANIKASGVTIYTIHVNTDGDPTSELLKNCAGSKTKTYDPSKFFTVTSASGISTVFTQIGTNLTQLRVAR
ncbi:MAG: pilus assembly protein [Proteobacteria bacterium]|nr:pilus assembly protein [Pseudomonadota bacterium]